MRRVFIIFFGLLLPLCMHADYARRRSSMQQRRMPPRETRNMGHEVDQGQMPAGYNHPGGIDTIGWDVFLNVSYIYWQPRQDGMALAIPFNVAAAHPANEVVYQDFAFKSGFKVGGGFKSDSLDDWGGMIEYTRLHTSEPTNASTAATEPFRMNNWVSQNNNLANEFSSRWSVDLDLIDFGLFRTYYVGRHLIFSTLFGGRGGWLDQDLDFTAQIPLANGPIPTLVTNRSRSWFVGPRAALNTNWILGYGVRLIGNLSGAINYQKYELQHTETETIMLNGTGLSTNLNEGFIRPYFDLALGMGWGTYAWDHRIHFDLSASYDFMVWFSQNMMRVLTDITAFGGEASPANLYYHGLTLKAQMNF